MIDSRQTMIQTGEEGTLPSPSSPPAPTLIDAAAAEASLLHHFYLVSLLFCLFFVHHWSGGREDVLTSTTHDYNELQTQPNGGFNNENRTPKNQGWGKIMYLDSSGAAAAVEEGNSADEEVEESRDKGFLRGRGWLPSSSALLRRQGLLHLISAAPEEPPWPVTI
jgi:hypothetical protein